MKKVPGTQQELDKMGVKIKIEQFKSGAINKPVSIPNTYERLKQHPAGPEQITSSMVEGTIRSGRYHGIHYCTRGTYWRRFKPVVLLNRDC